MRVGTRILFSFQVAASMKKPGDSPPRLRKSIDKTPRPCRALGTVPGFFTDRHLWTARSHSRLGAGRSGCLTLWDIKDAALGWLEDRFMPRIRFYRHGGITCFTLGLMLANTQVSAGATEAVDFQRQVRPILSDNCFACHGPDAKTRMADLRLDTREGAFAQRENGSPIVPRDSDASLLYQRIKHENEILRMPPAYSKKKLSEDQIDVLKRWIEQGASWDRHWSFQTLKRPELPTVKREEWSRNGIDRFILARLEAKGLASAPEADRRTLARRVALDVTGLPPEPELVEAFVNDTSQNAYEALVNQLLESPHWGEHRGRYWLDAARYGDTHGIHVDNYREMWPYRDWVINAFNQNMPFDQFTIEQIAGDLLPNATLEQRVATGFHRCNVTTNEAGLIIDEYAAVYAKDRADTTGTVWLGLTVGCATCHDHKFDPISQRDFYAMTAFFRNTTQYVMDGNVADPPPIAVVPRQEDRTRWDELKHKAAEINARMRKVSASADEDFEAWLASGEYRSLEAPLGTASEVFALSLGKEARATLHGDEFAVDLSHGVTLGAGPEGRGALRFGSETWAELPNVKLDADKPFSLAVWIHNPDEQGRFIVASQTDPEDKNRGWALTIGAEVARVPGLHLFGDQEEKLGDDGKPVEIFTGWMQQLEVGTWNHVAVTYDGTSERAGLNIYVNGEILPTTGSEYFKKLHGNIRTDQPLLLGKLHRKLENEDFERYFAGGGIADFRIFNRVITVEEVRIVSRWPSLERAREKDPSQLTREQRETLRLYYLSLKNDDYRGLVEEKRQVARKQREIRRRGGITHVMQEITDREPEAHILYRGMYDQPQDLVKANTPAALAPMPASFPRNRLGLAKWLVDDSNPLSARVVVNRFWQEVFGTGIVKSSDDFGSQGEPPSHPELLDWLAVEFRASGWDVKDFFRLLVTSSTYRQSAAITKEKLEQDPENRLLSRGPRFRLDGELLRDYALAASGLLVPTIGGPSVKPYQPPGVWESVAMEDSNTHSYQQDHGDKLYRRSLYTFWKRSAPPASMDVFNAPTRETCTVRRERTNTPLQALVTMNDPQFVEASRYLAQRAMRETGGNFDRQLNYITLRVLARELEGNEREVAKRAYDDFASHYASHIDDADHLLATGESKPEATLPVVQSAALTMLANQLMNLDEVLNK